MRGAPPGALLDLSGGESETAMMRSDWARPAVLFRKAAANSAWSNPCKHEKIVEGKSLCGAADEVEDAG